jgi:ATP-binding cassette subfamily F protein 3
MFDPSTAEPALAKLPMSELMKRRADVADKLEAAEAKWLEASEALEQAAV